MKIKIFLIEDNYQDIELIIEAMHIANLPHIIQAFNDAEETLNYIKTQEKPDLIIIDLNLPRMSGIDFLKEIKNSELKHIPVIMLTTSDNDKDVIRAYKNYCNAYIRKESEIDEIVNILKSINEFWVGTAIIPNK